MAVSIKILKKSPIHKAQLFNLSQDLPNLIIKLEYKWSNKWANQYKRVLIIFQWTALLLVEEGQLQSWIKISNPKMKKRKMHNSLLFK